MIASCFIRAVPAWHRTLDRAESRGGLKMIDGCSRPWGRADLQFAKNARSCWRSVSVFWRWLGAPHSCRDAAGIVALVDDRANDSLRCVSGRDCHDAWSCRAACERDVDLTERFGIGPDGDAGRGGIEPDDDDTGPSAAAATGSALHERVHPASDRCRETCARDPGGGQAQGPRAGTLWV